MRAGLQPGKAGRGKNSLFPLLASDFQELKHSSGGGANLPATAHLGKDFVCILKALPALRQMAECRIDLLRITGHMFCGAAKIGIADGIADANVHCSQDSFPAAANNANGSQ